MPISCSVLPEDQKCKVGNFVVNTHIQSGAVTSSDARRSYQEGSTTPQDLDSEDPNLRGRMVLKEALFGHVGMTLLPRLVVSSRQVRGLSQRAIWPGPPFLLSGGVGNCWFFSPLSKSLSCLPHLISVNSIPLALPPLQPSSYFQSCQGPNTCNLPIPPNPIIPLAAGGWCVSALLPDPSPCLWKSLGFWQNTSSKTPHLRHSQPQFSNLMIPQLRRPFSIWVTIPF